MSSRFWVGGTGNWDATTTTQWSATSGGPGGASVPTSVDDVFFDANSGVGTMTIPGVAQQNYCNNLILTGSTITLLTGLFSTINIYGNFVGNNLVIQSAIFLTFVASSGTKTVQSNGYIFEANVAFTGSGATYLLLDNITSTVNILLSGATLDTNGFAMIAVGFSLQSVNSTIYLRSGTHIISGYSYGWQVNAGNVDAGTSTIKFTNTATLAIVPFSGGNKIYNNVWFSRGSSTYGITITGANTFNDFKDDGAGTHTIIFPNSTTTVNTFSVSGVDSTHKITLSRTGASGNFTLEKAGGGVISSDCLSVSNGIGSPANTWYMRANSTDGGGNTNIYFTVLPLFNSKFFQFF